MSTAFKRLAVLVVGTCALSLSHGCRASEAVSPISDPVSTSVSNEDLARYLAELDAAAGFTREGNPWLLQDSQTTVVLHLPSQNQTEDDARRGIVIARIIASADYNFGLRQGVNYLWMDRLGSAPGYWRGVMISADGSSRKVLRKFTYTPGEMHRDPASPSSHSRGNCNGLQGCFFIRQGIQETIWNGCVNGCCEVEDP